jgi:hypothetical protein
MLLLAGDSPEESDGAVLVVGANVEGSVPLTGELHPAIAAAPSENATAARVAFTIKRGTAIIISPKKDGRSIAIKVRGLPADPWLPSAQGNGRAIS